MILHEITYQTHTQGQPFIVKDLGRKKKRNLLGQTKQLKEEGIHIFPSYFQCTDVLCTHHNILHSDILLHPDQVLERILLPLHI